MNCECVYYNPGATYEDYEALADKIACDVYELYPVAISRVDEPMLVSDVYDPQKGETSYIPGQRFVLFVYGKLRHMAWIPKANEKNFHSFFPVGDPKFTDLELF